MRHFGLGVLAVVIAAGCSTETATSLKLNTSSSAIAAAHVYVGGNLADGQVIRGAMGQTLFEVRLKDPGQRGDLQRVMMRYEIPGMGGDMMRRSGEQICYDDGTHGDLMAGDGIYHYMDEDDRVGCGRANSPVGDYQYHFRCEFNDGSRTGEVSVVVKRS